MVFCLWSIIFLKEVDRHVAIGLLAQPTQSILGPPRRWRCAR